MNKVILMGRLGRDPEKRFASSGGDPIVSFSLATSSYSKGEKRDPDWHNCVTFGKTAETAEQYLKKGSQILIEGKIQYRKYKDKNEVEKTITNIVVDRFEFTGPKPEGDKAEDPKSNQPTIDELPF